MTKGYIPEDKIEEIRSKTDIVDLISGFVTLKKAGRNYLGLCPFHAEKTPSFNVNPDRQIYHCFGCGEGGNAVTFLMKVNAMSFPEAIRALAQRAGVLLPERDLTPQEREKGSRREQIVRVNRLAESHFTRNLASPVGNVARDYLAKRGIGDESVRTFRLGYAPDGWRDLLNFLTAKKAPLALAQEAGLLVAKDNGTYYDRFRGRLMFPIDDGMGRTVAFGGRVIGSGEPKYLNSPETPAYVKGRVLYGLAANREDIRTRGYAVLVEGYLDLISLWNGGVRNVVATLGTALTKDHAALLKRYTDTVAVVFDSDAAGLKALARSLEIFLTADLKIRAVILPESYDPDDYIRRYGQEAFEACVAKAPSAVEYYIDSVLGQRRGSLDQDLARLKEALGFLAAVQNPLELGFFVKRISERLGVDEALMRREVLGIAKAAPEVRQQADEKKPAVPRPAKLQVQPAELELLVMLLEHPEKWRTVREMEVLAAFIDERLRKAGEPILAAAEKAGSAFDATRVVEGLSDEAVRSLLLGRLITAAPRHDAATFERVFADTVRRIRKDWYRHRQKQLQMELVKAQEAGDEPRVGRLLADKKRLHEEEKANLI